MIAERTQSSWTSNIKNLLLFVLVLAVVGLVTWGTISGLFGGLIDRIGDLYMNEDLTLNSSIAPEWLVNFEKSTNIFNYIVWILTPILLVLFMAFPKLRKPLVESWESHDVRFGLLASAVLSGITGFLWAVWNPVPIIPGAVHLRIFAFLIGVWGIVIGRGTGFLTGYFGGVVWALLGGYWIWSHTPVMDGIMVGVMTGWFISVVARRGRSREEMLAELDKGWAARLKFYLICAVASLIAGLVMSTFVAASLKAATSMSWWAGFWSIGVLSDTIPMVIWVGPVSEIVLRLLRRNTWIGKGF